MLTSAPAAQRSLRVIQSIDECVSPEERRRRLMVALSSGLAWFVLLLLAIAFFVAIPIVVAGWILNWLLSEYHVRRLQALGTTASPEQFPEVAAAMAEVCRQFQLVAVPPVIILGHEQMNAFAIRFARKKVVVLLSKTLEGVADHPAELRFILGHELGHILLDFSWRGRFEIYKPAAYRAAREMTCDNCGCAAAGELPAAKHALKRLVAGNLLVDRLNEDYLQAEADHLYSGFTGWLLRRYLTYPPLGRRLQGVTEFASAK